MNNDSQTQPPTYSAVYNKSALPSSGSQGNPYTAPQQETVDVVKYPAVSSTAPTFTPMNTVSPVTFGRNSVQCTCPNCHSMIITRTEETTGVLAWLLCIILLVFGCWLGCCLIPFCISDLQNTQHYCPNCNIFLGENRPL